ncbi:hypothetical protein Q5P01_024410 [Channa striata]|uniref:Tripartite motif-containing protein 16-like n=1 Tax=Channa striata TaxID=64152 RepID=A0AA88IZU5_CHASR|nr:hypothetical protein Q5P01_024410 [Channa striata]
MAKQGIQLDQDKLCCSICLDLLRHPVTIPCGHSYCMSCIKSCWDEEDQRGSHSCPQCRQSFRPRPVLVKNTMLADLVEELKKTQKMDLPAASADPCYARHGDVTCDFCTGMKRKATKTCLQCQVSSCELHLQPHYEVAPLKKHKLVETSVNIQENICSRHNEVMKIFCRTDKHHICYLCLMNEHKGHDTVSVEAEITVKNNEKMLNELVRAIRKRSSDTKQQIKSRQKAQVNWTNYWTLSAKGGPRSHRWRLTRIADFIKYSQQLTLDRNTANSEVSLSEGNRKATNMEVSQLYPSHPDRFTDMCQVLSNQSLTTRCYWEVDWSGGGVSVAVTHKDINRRGNDSGFGNNDKSWALECSPSGSCHLKHANIKTSTSGPKASRVGVYLDHSAGTLSFYSVSETMSLLHRVRTTFTQPLYAGLCVYYFGSTAELCELK